MNFSYLGENEKAMECFKKCEEIQKSRMGDIHPYYAITLSNFGLLYYKLGQYENSALYFERCIQIQ